MVNAAPAALLISVADPKSPYNCRDIVVLAANVRITSLLNADDVRTGAIDDATFAVPLISNREPSNNPAVKLIWYVI